MTATTGPSVTSRRKTPTALLLSATTDVGLVLTLLQRNGRGRC